MREREPPPQDTDGSSRLFGLTRGAQAAIGTAAAALAIVGFVIGLVGGHDPARRLDRAALPAPRAWAVTHATGEQRASLPPVVTRAAGSAVGVLVDPSGRRYVTAATRAPTRPAAERRVLALEERTGVVQGSLRYDEVDVSSTTATSPTAFAFVATVRDGGQAGVWMDRRPPRALLDASGARAPHGELVSSSLTGVRCRASSAQSISARFGPSPPRRIARREASTCATRHGRLAIVAFEPQHDVDADVPLALQNRAFDVERFRTVALPCRGSGSVDAVGLGANSILSFYVNRGGRPRWGFIIVSPHRRDALRMACRLVDTAPPG